MASGVNVIVMIFSVFAYFRRFSLLFGDFSPILGEKIDVFFS
jgi:hypothetical protein